MVETLTDYCKRTEQEKRELSQKISQMECQTFQLEKVIVGLKDENERLENHLAATHYPDGVWDRLHKSVSECERLRRENYKLTREIAQIKTHNPAHCDHEEICRFYQYDQKIVIHSYPPCMRNHEGCAECAYDSRKQPR